MSPDTGILLCSDVVPRICSAIPAAVKCVGCEDDEEVIQDGVALAAKMMHNAERAGKKPSMPGSDQPLIICWGKIHRSRVQNPIQTH